MDTSVSDSENSAEDIHCTVSYCIALLLSANLKVLTPAYESV